MRLINTTTLQHETFTGTIPNYAILSHTWNPADITFVQFQNGIRNDKIRNFCARAREEGLEFGWIDFCCINRSNNAELHDAINSMYNWYERAVVCYTHLEDLSIFWSVRSNEMEVLLRACRWFTRGWTLIELIAPPRVQFYSADWSLIGTRDTLSSPISRLSGVPLELLIATKAPSDYEVSEKMGWAKNRKTRRAEDQAYSLMGLFGITMPIQYGEGGVAFARLREEIRKTEAFLSLGKQVPGLRLLVAQSSSLEIQSFHAGSIPDYAILSHTWSNDEVSFQDIQNGSISEESIGYQKIKSCCRLAASHGFRYLWVDTCCIDKSSSTELQEAICSMYEWYKSAKICYAYLADYHIGHNNDLRSCKWFWRGWTLQELIAPRVVEFYDATWNEIGTKSSLCNEIALITAIDAPILWGADIKKRSVAERMSWASSRSTTRMEDIAYCLMGIFDVYMPMLYGEGARAFLRLQQEIMSKSEDYTIFAWRSEYSNNSRQGIFATSPAAFSLYRPSSTPISVPSSFLVSNCSPIVEEKEHPALLTSRGLLVTWPLLNEDTRRDIYMAAICSTPELHDAQGNLHPACIICIALQKLPDHRPATYARAHPRQLFIRPYELSRHFQKESIYLSLSQPPADLVVLPWVRTAGLLNIQTALKFRNLPNEDPSTTCHWVGKKVFYSYKDSYSGVVANLEFSELDGDECEEFTVTVEFINNRPHCCIHTLKDKDPSTRPLCVEGHPSVDRARKVLTADDATITATIRPGPSTEETPIVHSLFIDHRPVMKPGVTTSALRLSAMDEWTQRWSESQ